MKILILMIVMHVLDDFVLQAQCLSNLKQKDWWFRKGFYKDPFKFDYLCAGLIHSLSWSCMISLPLLFLADLDLQGETHLFYLFFINIVVHFIVDELKANLKIINLWVDQTIHICQVILLYVLCT
jgi:hypothetical protein